MRGDQQMVTQSNPHFFTNWAKERLDEMDAAVTSLESKVAEVQADVRDKAEKILAELRKQRDDFRDTMKKQSPGRSVETPPLVVGQTPPLSEAGRRDYLAGFV
jgi:predicted phage gp36 major capsid-like protein